MEERVLIGTAVSGGTLRELLSSAVRTYGADRLVLGMERLAMDFPMPCPSGRGISLSGEALDALRRRAGGHVFFSEALCAKYFTYRAPDGVRLVLFDDADTLRRKQAISRSLGIRDAFLLCNL